MSGSRSRRARRGAFAQADSDVGLRGGTHFRARRANWPPTDPSLVIGDAPEIPKSIACWAPGERSVVTTTEAPVPDSWKKSAAAITVAGRRARPLHTRAADRRIGRGQLHPVASDRTETVTRASIRGNLRRDARRLRAPRASTHLPDRRLSRIDGRSRVRGGFDPSGLPDLRSAGAAACRPWRIRRNSPARSRALAASNITPRTRRRVSTRPASAPYQRTPTQEPQSKNSPPMPSGRRCEGAAWLTRKREVASAHPAQAPLQCRCGECRQSLRPTCP